MNDLEYTLEHMPDYQEFIKYLHQLVPVLLDAKKSSITDLNKCLNEKLNVETIKKFMSDQRVRSLIIQKNLTKGNDSKILRKNLI
jgi:dynein heavy chain 1